MTTNYTISLAEFQVSFFNDKAQLALVIGGVQMSDKPLSKSPMTH